MRAVCMLTARRRRYRATRGVLLGLRVRDRVMARGWRQVVGARMPGPAPIGIRYSQTTPSPSRSVYQAYSGSVPRTYGVCAPAAFAAVQVS
jgi:hypothetical protein